MFLRPFARPAVVTVGWVGLALLLAGCSAKHYRNRADRQVYGIIQEVESRVFGRTNTFSIDTPYSGRPPDDILSPELVEDRLRTNQRVLTLSQTLDVAVQYSRTYQTEKERLYLTTLTLTGERYAFRPQFFTTVTGNYDRLSNGEQTGSLNTRVGVNQLLMSGGRLGVNIVNDLFRYYTGDPRRSAISSISVNIAQPLLRGFGRNNAAVESITQAERNVVYAVRSYAYFQDQFALGIVTDYFNLLSLKDTVRNQYNNYRGRVANREYLEARKDRESRSGVDQARQAELTSKNTYINAVSSYLTALDQFKIRLGLPLGEKLQLHDSDLRDLQEAGPSPLALDRIKAYRLAVERQLTIVNAIDRFEDAKRKVRVAKDRLRADLNIFADAALDSDRPTDYTQFDPDRWRGGVGFELDLPFDRLRERNAYRSTLVTFESELRNLTLTLDNLRQSIDVGLRNLAQRNQNYMIQTNALALARDRVDGEFLRQQAGLNTPRDVIEAQDDLVVAQNAVTDSLIRYHLVRLGLLLDIGVLESEGDKFWLREHLPAELIPADPTADPAFLEAGRLITPEELFPPTP